MPPRITRKSYRPRASDRTMVDNVQPRSLSCFRIRKRRHENRMDLGRANTPEPLNMTWAGERSEHFCSFQSPQIFFLLTLPFIERAYRRSWYWDLSHIAYPLPTVKHLQSPCLAALTPPELLACAHRGVPGRKLPYNPVRAERRSYVIGHRASLSTTRKKHEERFVGDVIISQECKARRKTKKAPHRTKCALLPVC